MAKKNAAPNPPKKWAAFEAVVAAIHRQFGESAIITENEIIVGKSGTPRQCDVTIRTNVCGYSILIVVECKKYNRPVEVGKVDALAGKIEDVGAAKGILISDSGFTDGALRGRLEIGR